MPNVCASIIFYWAMIVWALQTGINKNAQAQTRKKQVILNKIKKITATSRNISKNLTPAAIPPQTENTAMRMRGTSIIVN